MAMKKMKTLIQAKRNCFRDYLTMTIWSAAQLNVRYLMIALLLASSALLPKFIGNALALNQSEVPPEFSLISQSGKTVSLSDYRGKVVYLDFWASWCGPCRHTLPWMQQIQSKFKSQGLEVVAINLDTNRADAEKLLEGLSPTFTILFDPLGKAASKYQLPSMPSSYLIGKDGKVVVAHSGFREGDDRVLEAEIEKLLNMKR